MADRARPLNWPTALGLLVVLFGPPLLVVIPNRFLGGTLSLATHAVLQLLLCAMAAFVVFLVVKVEGQPVGTIGIRRPDWMTPIVAVVLFLLAFVLQGMVTAPLARRWGTAGVDAGVAAIRQWPAWFRVFVAVTGGIAEETLYRGYAVEKLIAVTGRTWLGAALATAVFGVAHIPAWGAAFALTADLVAGILLVLFYVWRRDLVANILAHTAGLFLGLFAIPL